MLDPYQKQAVEHLSKTGSYSLACLVGGAGRGKTFTITEILQQFHDGGLDKIYIATPTGKAADVVKKSLAIDIPNKPMTIHRLLGCQGHGKWTYNPDNPLDASMIILDESSMIGSLLMARLIKSVNEDCVFILTGDDKQLPPVDAGMPFKDIIRIGKNIHKLHINHRQENGCKIADACEKIRKGQMFNFSGNLKRHVEDEHEAVTAAVIDWWVKTPYSDKIILVPQKTTKIGVTEINKALKAAVNPCKGESFNIGFDSVNIGDKVIQTVNNYKLGVFNGMIGIVKDIRKKTDNGEDEMIVDFDGEQIAYDSLSAKNLQLGYAITIHKSQGSQWKHGLIIASRTHTYMWTRCLLYTALSRFQETCTIIGEDIVIKRAIKNNKDINRNTWLKKRC